MFDLPSYLADCKQAIEAVLNEVIPAAGEPPAVLHEAMRYSVFSGGKRIRPILALAAAECLGQPRSAARYPAAAVELLHTYTLIHDDLPCMDNDDLRRGKLTNHKVFGEANALLAGDALLTLAFEVAATTPIAPAEVVRTLAAAAGSRGVVGGQVADLAADPTKTAPNDILFIHEHKTADLFRAALQMAAIASGADANTLQALCTYGRSFGLAFQVVDDILDADNPQDQSFSCVHVMGLPWARERVETLTRETLQSLDGFGSAADPLRAIAKHTLERTS